MGATSCKCEGDAARRRQSMTPEKEPTLISSRDEQDPLEKMMRKQDVASKKKEVSEHVREQVGDMGSKQNKDCVSDYDSSVDPESSTIAGASSSGNEKMEEVDCFAQEQKSFAYLVVGGGVAAGYACRELMEQGVGPNMVGVVCAEPVCPYERPALSKAYLHPPNAKVRARLPGFHTCVGSGGERQEPAWYEEKGIHILQGTITDLSLSDKCVVTSDGKTYYYEKLFLATGSRAKKLDIPGYQTEGVFFLRQEQDFAKLVTVLERLYQPLKNGKAANGVVIGASYIGLETAAALLGWGLNVTIVTSKRDVLIPRLLSRELDQWLRDQFIKRGAKFTTGEAAAFETKNGKLLGVRMASGEVLPCSISIVGVGAEPNLEFCQGVLDFTRGGLKVNHMLQTSDPDVYAMGDICSYPNAKGTEYKRHCHVDFARKSASFAVQASMGLTDRAFTYLPYSYTRMFEYTENPVGYIFFGVTSKTVRVDRVGDCIIRAVFLINDRVAGAFIMSSPTSVPLGIALLRSIYGVASLR